MCASVCADVCETLTACGHAATKHITQLFSSVIIVQTHLKDDEVGNKLLQHTEDRLLQLQTKPRDKVWFLLVSSGLLILPQWRQSARACSAVEYIGLFPDFRLKL